MKKSKAGVSEEGKGVSDELLQRMNGYWRAANYLSVGQIYLLNNGLLKEPLTLAHVKPRLLGHWGTTPGLNFIYVHLNRIITEQALNMIYVTGPGHGGPGLVANTYLEGTYSELYPTVTQDEQGIQKLFKQFSFPGGIPSHVAAEVPGSIHEGGELGYSLAHAYGAVLDNPSLIVACVVGDGEAETGPLATSWHSNKFINPARDGVVLPILHLNGYKIANPTILARISDDELLDLFSGYGYKPYVVEGNEPFAAHRIMANTLDSVMSDIRFIKENAQTSTADTCPKWPMIILRTPKGWTGPKEVDHQPVEGTWRAHQVPLDGIGKNAQHLEMLEAWMKSYRPEELFDERGCFMKDIAELAPVGDARMSANPHANGGMLMKPLIFPDFRDYAFKLDIPGTQTAEATSIMGAFVRDIMKLNREQKNFRLFGPDETASNRLAKVYEVTNKVWSARLVEGDNYLSRDGRVMEVLSEHLCQGWLEGYLLTGRHGLFSCYEAFIHIVDSMVNQHAKWLKLTRRLSWRRPIPSLNYLLTSHVWRQDHNGDSHQDPGFLDHVANKSAEIVRIYLPPDANTLLSVANHCLRSTNYINVIVAGKQPELQWLSIGEAQAHCAAGMGIWSWASNDGGSEPDLVMACAGDVPTLETMAAVALLREHFPDLKIRVVNVVDLMSLQPASAHPHGWRDEDFDRVFTKNKPVIFAFHGYPTLIHSLVYKRTNHNNIHVHGYRGEGTTTTPFDMVVINNLDRYHLAENAVDRVRPNKAAEFKEHIKEKLSHHISYTREHGEDMPEVRNWKWNAS